MTRPTPRGDGIPPDTVPDLCDYPMSDTAICEARRVGLSPGLPYRRGFRDRSRLPSWETRPTFKEILALSESDFRRYLQCSALYEDDFVTDPHDSLLEELRRSIRSLEQQVTALTRLLKPSVAPTPQQGTRLATGAARQEGLRVDSR
jgi:hypothetical protein